VNKGIAIPTCISVNNICAYYSPLVAESTSLQEGDVAKIELGVHIDGFVANVATTILVGATAENPATGKKAGVIQAAHEAFTAALSKLQVGEENYAVTEAMCGIPEKYGCNMLEGALSHQLKHHVIDANQVILAKDTVDQHVEPFNFAVNEVYALDIYVSTGEGKGRESEFRTTVFKRALDTTYSLKLKGSRLFFAELNQRFPTLMFTLRAFSDERNARMGVNECLKNHLLEAYPVVVERPGEFVAQFKATVLLTDRGQLVITPPPFNSELYRAEPAST
jgi:curved DNA binding protein